MALALHHSQAKGTDKVVLLGIANHAGDGGSWPSVPTLAVYANVDERTVQRSIDNLVALGEVRREVQAGGTARMADWDRPNLYTVTIRCPENCDGTRKHVVYCVQCAKPLAGKERRLRLLRHRKPECAQPRVTDTPPEGVTPTSPGDAHVTGGVTPTSPKPSINHPVTRDRSIPLREQTCASARGRTHSIVAGRCGWCGIREDEQ